jgi:hypothetical protein
MLRVYACLVATIERSWGKTGNTFPAALSAFIASRTPGNYLPATEHKTAAPKSTGSFSLGSIIGHPAQYDAKGDASEEGRSCRGMIAGRRDLPTIFACSWI